MAEAPAPVDQILKSASLFSAHSCLISRRTVVAVLKTSRHVVAASKIVDSSDMVRAVPRDHVPTWRAKH